MGGIETTRPQQRVVQEIAARSPTSPIEILHKPKLPFVPNVRMCSFQLHARLFGTLSQARDPEAETRTRLSLTEHEEIIPRHGFDPISASTARYRTIIFASGYYRMIHEQANTPPIRSPPLPSYRARRVGRFSHCPRPARQEAEGK